VRGHGHLPAWTTSAPRSSPLASLLESALRQDRYTPSLPLAIALARFFSQPVEEVFHANGIE
jgi:hypothetical protein